MRLSPDRSQQPLHKAAVEAQPQFVAPGFLPLALADRPRQKPAEMPLALHLGDAPASSDWLTHISDLIALTLTISDPSSVPPPQSTDEFIAHCDTACHMAKLLPD
jgi:hypothetical protein